MEKDYKQSNALELLLRYRPELWRKTTLEAVSGIHNESLLVCLEQLYATQKLVETLKSDERLGEKMYWIIQATFMTEKQPKNIDDILDDIAARCAHIPRRTYFRLKKRAIEMLDYRKSNKRVKKS